MFQRLQKKWKVNGWQLLVVLIIFAVGGSLTGFAGRKLMKLFDIEILILDILVYLIVITILWPFAVLLVSIPFGQFPFFKKYISKLGNRLFVRKKH